MCPNDCMSGRVLWFVSVTLLLEVGVEREGAQVEAHQIIHTRVLLLCEHIATIHITSIRRTQSA